MKYIDISMSAPKVILYSCLHAKIRHTLETGQSHAVMGEIIMFISAIRVLKERGFRVQVVGSRDEFIAEDRGAVFYILDYLTIKEVGDLVLVPGRVHRVRLFCYWGRRADEIPWRGAGGVTIGVEQVCTPYPYPGKPNSFLGFLMPGLVAADAGASVGLDPSIRGYIWGKEAKYFDKQLLADLSGEKVYATSVDRLSGAWSSSVVNLGLQKREDYLSIVRHCDYVLGFGDPIAGPTVIETLQMGKTLIAPRRQVPAFLHWHPNVVLSDGLGAAGILQVLRDLRAGNRGRADMGAASTTGVPEFTEAAYTARSRTIFPDPPARRYCIIRSSMRDNNIFHFLVFEIKALWDFISKNRRVDYVVFLLDYDEASAAHRWRRGLIERLGAKVYSPRDAVDATIFDYAIMDIPLRVAAPMIKSFEYVTYGGEGLALCDYISGEPSAQINPSASRQDSAGVLLIQRRGTRVLCCAGNSGTGLEVELEPLCLAAGIPFRCAYFEDMTLAEQVDAMQSAHWVVAAHGAAETNIIFCRRGTKLIEVNMRPHWYCDPVCDAHFSGKIGAHTACKGKLTTWPTYHKADYHNLAGYCGISYAEVDPIGYEGGFADRNPISKRRILVSATDIMKHIV